MCRCWQAASTTTEVKKLLLTLADTFLRLSTALPKYDTQAWRCLSPFCIDARLWKLDEGSFLRDTRSRLVPRMLDDLQPCLPTRDCCNFQLSSGLRFICMCSTRVNFCLMLKTVPP